MNLSQIKIIQTHTSLEENSSNKLSNELRLNYWNIMLQDNSKKLINYKISITYKSFAVNIKITYRTEQVYKLSNSQLTFSIFYDL